MRTIELQPSEIIPTNEGKTTPRLEKIVEVGQKLVIDVIVLPENNSLKEAFCVDYLILTGNNARATAQHNSISLRANILEPSDCDYYPQLEQATQKASVYYEGFL